MLSAAENLMPSEFRSLQGSDTFKIPESSRFCSLQKLLLPFAGIVRIK